MKKLLLSMLSLFAVASICAQVPFKVTTIENGEFAEGTTWYTMVIGDGALGIKDNEGAEYITLGRVKYEDKDLWCFVGDATDGYAVYNKQAGTTKVLASKTTMEAINGYGGTGGSTYPIMQPVDALPEGYVGRWDFSSSDKIANAEGYFMKIHGTGYAVNNFGGRGILAFWAEGADASSTIRFGVAEASIEILVSEGQFTSSNSNGTCHAKWESNKVNGFSLSTGANNMQAVDDNIAGYSGTASSSTYTLTAPEGLVVVGYSFDFVNTNIDENYALTLTVGDKTYTSSATTQSVNVVIEEPERAATFTQSGENKGITFSNFKVMLKPDVREPEPNFEVFPTLTSAAIPYRIPAIATASNGDIIAVADYRHSRADIGMATDGRIDLRARISKDYGKTWGDIFDIVQGKGAAGKDTPNQMYVGFGDPCIVADRESAEVLVISCSGNVSFPNGQRNNHQGIVHFYSNDYGVTWTEPVDRSESIYSQFDNTQYGPVRAMFVGSGKISQSKYIKVNNYYRLYCAVLVKDVNGTHVNFVLYSDDFGGTWTVLGGADLSPIPSGGDEPKADELPDGSVIISSRTNGGRIYNIFSYTDSKKAEGSWGISKWSNNSNNGTIAVNNSTNGEIMFVPVKRVADDKKMYLALQSVPFGSGRANVGIYYKELETLADFVSPEAIAADWDGRHQASYLGGAYSTMTLQKDNNVGFLYEEETNCGSGGGGYTIVYKNYSIEYITGGAYVYDAEANHEEIVSAGIEHKKAGIAISEDKFVGCVDADEIATIESAIDAYKATPSYEAYEAINKAISNLSQLEVEAGKWYRIRNSERSGATLYLNPEASRLSVATSKTDNADQLFTFVPTGNDKEYYLYNGNYQYMLGPLGNNETEPAVTTSKGNAGKWKISSTTNCLSSIICQNKTGGNSGLHLSGDNKRLVPWTNTDNASLWYIEPVDEISLEIDGLLAVCLPFAMTLPEGVDAYVAGNTVTVNDVSGVELYEYGATVVAENTPVVLVAKSGTYKIGVGGEYEEYKGKNNLKGVLKGKNVSGAGVYTMQNGKFVKRKSSSGAITANTAYYLSDSEAQELGFWVKEGEFTSIDSVEKDSEPVKLYDLKGNVVEKPVRGIYITSKGKKVLVK